ncbi:MAG: DUF302 domain-containing protein [Proteobacteria bacterium]|nr:DUF302 domain-containing protein [Pseudomonadota bacterium]MCP4921496.1 DUF302 domain-containing protein [Pseudomonadota bacterium]
MSLDSRYSLTRSLGDTPFDQAVARTRTALGGEGFGVLTEIDMTATLQKKLGVEVEDYLVLGACNPPLAYEALSADRAIGLLLPCNVVVSRRDGVTTVAAIDPDAMFSVVGRDDVAPIAAQVKAKLERALAAV